MTKLAGFRYDKKRKRAVFDGYVAGTNGKVRRQRTIDNVTHDQALAAWKTFRADLASGRAIEGPLTLTEFVTKYYDLIAANHTAGTRKSQGVIIKNHLLRYFGDAELTTITTIRVIDFMADMRSLACSASYINNAVRVLKMLLRQAVERDVIADYPIKKKVPREKEVPLRLELKPGERARFYATFDDEAAFRACIDHRRRLGPEQESAHFDAERRFGGGMRGDSKAAGAYFARYRELREFFIIAVETGLRAWSDLRNLKWSSVDLAGGFVRVLMQKTQREAEIPISTACREAFGVCQTKAVASVYVFVDVHGRRFTESRTRRAFLLAKELAGITRRFRPHDLRHTFGCRLADRNISLQKIAKALGHTTTRMAERYARPSEESMREITRALDADPVLVSVSQPPSRRVMLQPELDRMNRIIAKIAFGLFTRRYGVVPHTEDVQAVGIFPHNIEDHRPIHAFVLTYRENFQPKRWIHVQNGVFSYLMVRGFLAFASRREPVNAHVDERWRHPVRRRRYLTGRGDHARPARHLADGSAGMSDRGR